MKCDYQDVLLVIRKCIFLGYGICTYKKLKGDPKACRLKEMEKQ